MNLDGVKLRRLREDSGFTLRSLAAKAMISPAHLSMIESGHRGVSPPVAARLASVLSTSIAELREQR